MTCRTVTTCDRCGADITGQHMASAHLKLVTSKVDSFSLDWCMPCWGVIGRKAQKGKPE